MSNLEPAGGFENSIALVTGASRGIGLAIAEHLAREGAHVLLVARNAKALSLASRRFRGKAEAISTDVRRPDQVKRLFRQVQNRHRRLDVLINCAGAFTYKPLSETTIQDWQDSIETNLTSLFLTTQAALPLFAQSRSPRLVNILSISSLRAFPNCSAYTAAKFGALGLTRVLREELRSQGVRVTAVLPGMTETEMLKEFGFKIPRTRVMQTEDVAEAVVSALRQPARSTVEELLLMPSRGSL